MATYRKFRLAFIDCSTVGGYWYSPIPSYSLGRPPGKKDTKERRKSGYYQRWANEK
jgi:hypothetical protein